MGKYQMFQIVWGRRWEEQQIKEVILAVAFGLQDLGVCLKKESLKNICKNLGTNARVCTVK